MSLSSLLHISNSRWFLTLYPFSHIQTKATQHAKFLHQTKPTFKLNSMLLYLSPLIVLLIYYYYNNSSREGDCLTRIQRESCGGNSSIVLREGKHAQFHPNICVHCSSKYWQQILKQHFSQTISKNLNFEVDRAPQRGPEVKYIDFQLQDQHSSSTESTGLSHKEFAAMGKASSQDQCASSDSVHDESSYSKQGQEMKGGLFLCNPELSINASQAEITQPIVQFPYAYADPYFTGLFTPYGPHNIPIQPQMMAAASGRVPLPVDLPEDGPIYVNAKQYHGILRRRQTRAKLEAQNKLVKTRKPYLHESRHQHALNRVRGSGGRFLSTKKQQAEGGSNGSPDTFHFGGYGEGGDLQQSDGRYGGGGVYNGNRRYASIVR